MNDFHPNAPQEPARQPPHNIEAEQGVLGALLLSNNAFERLSDFLEPDHFFEPIHGKVYEVIRDLIMSGKTATPVTLKDYLPVDMDLGGIKVGQYIARLAAEATTIVNAYDYGRTVKDLAVRRAIIETASELATRAFDAPPDASPDKLLEEAEGALYSIADKGRFGGGFVSFDEATIQAIDRASAQYMRDGAMAGLATGLHDLDALMGGLQESDLIILAGRPGMGKTALATNIAWNVSVKAAPEGGPVGFFSLEMSSEQLATRVMAEQTEIPSHAIRRGGLKEADFDKLADFQRERRGIPLSIDDTGGLSIGQLAARARRLKRKNGLSLLIVDYIQLMKGSSRRSSENRVQEVTEITTGLKALAKELKVPIIALSQLNRGVENREDKRPHLADLRESGSIEQDADVVLFVYREEYYHLMRKPPEAERDKYAQWVADGDKYNGKAEIIIGKQRHGPTGTVEVAFDSHVTRFSSLAHRDHLPERL